MGYMRDSFIDAANKSGTKELRAGTWWVLDDYSLATLPDGTQFVRAPKRAWKERDPDLQEYRPLVEYEALFLEFARLADGGGLDDELGTEKNAKVALQWAERRGVLGLTPARERGAWWGDPAGGPDDSVAAFAFEAWTANKTLRLFEAATREGGVDVDAIASIAASRYRGLITSSDSMARDWALQQAATNLQERVARHAYPQIYQRPTKTFVEGYDFANLCGAIWLQALWLLTAEDVRRCEYPLCNRILAYEQPEKPSEQKRGERKPSKTYKNKRFCGNTCAKYNRRRLERLQNTS